MDTAKRLMKVFLLLSLLGAAGAEAQTPTLHKINASTIGMGGAGRTISWGTESQQSGVACSNACGYLRVSTAKIAPDILWTYLPTAWPDNSVTSIPAPAFVQSQATTPVDTSSNPL